MFLWQVPYFITLLSDVVSFKELRGIDQLYKYSWVQLVYCMIEGMAGNLTYTTDLHLFINVINGAFLLHCEDSSMLRLCLATYINTAHIFNNLFATNGLERKNNYRSVFSSSVCVCVCVLYKSIRIVLQSADLHLRRGGCVSEYMHL